MNEFLLLQSWIHPFSKELTKRQARSMINKLKVSKLTQFRVGDDDHLYAKAHVVYNRKPKPPSATTFSTTKNQLTFKDTCTTDKLVWNGMVIQYCSKDENDCYFTLRDELGEKSRVHTKVDIWIVWRNSLIFTNVASINRIELVELMKGGHPSENLIKNINKGMVMFDFSVNSKTGDVYYCTSEGLWRNSEKVIEGNKGSDFYVNVENGLAFISETRLSFLNETSSTYIINLYELKDRAAKAKHATIVGDYDYIRHKWTLFKGLSVFVIAVSTKDRTVINVYTFHKRAPFTFLGSLQIKDSYAIVYDLKLYVHKSTLKIICEYNIDEFLFE
jgi:hypothetical protein